MESNSIPLFVMIAITIIVIVLSLTLTLTLTLRKRKPDRYRLALQELENKLRSGEITKQEFEKRKFNLENRY